MLTLNQVPQNKHNLPIIGKIQQLATLLSQITNKYTFTPIYNGDLHYGYVKITSNTIPQSLDLNVKFDEYTKEFDFVNYSHYAYIDYNRRSDIEKQNQQIEKPKNTKKPNETKISDWVNYHIALHTEYEKKSIELQEKIENFKKSITQAENEGYNFTHYENKGWCEQNGIRFFYQIDKHSGYIQETISLDPISGIDNFKKLANNDYRK